MTKLEIEALLAVRRTTRRWRRCLELNQLDGDVRVSLAALEARCDEVLAGDGVRVFVRAPRGRVAA